jgi:hypothetical protein
MRIGGRSTRRKPASVPLCPPQILHELTRDQTLASAVRSRRLAAVVTLILSICPSRAEFFSEGGNSADFETFQIKTRVLDNAQKIDRCLVCIFTDLSCVSIEMYTTVFL